MSCGELPEEIGPGQIDEFVAAPTKHRFEHEEAKAADLLVAANRIGDAVQRVTRNSIDSLDVRSGQHLH